jgi:predicted DNA binding protein
METESDEMMEDIRISGSHIDGALVEALRKGKGVRTVATLEHTPRSLILRLTIDTTPIARIFKELHVLLRYPVQFGGGTIRLLLVAREDKVRAAFARLKIRAPDTVVVSIHHDCVAENGKLLTPKQGEVFRLAMSAGYWDVPRRITLSDLASLTDVSKSTIWATIAMIEKKLLYSVKDQYLTNLSLPAEPQPQN